MANRAVNNKRWSEEELCILKNNDNLFIEELLELLPNRTKNSIYIKANELGINVKRKNIKLTHKRYRVLEKYSKNSTIEELIRLFPELTKRQIERFLRYYNIEIKKEKIQEKKCSICGEIKKFNSDNFPLKKGIKSYCTECHYKKERYYYYKNNFGIELNDKYSIHTFSVIEWYEFTFETPNGNKLNKLPHEFYSKDFLVKIWRYGIMHKLNMKTKEDILSLQQQDLIGIGVPYKDCKNKRFYTTFEIIKLTFPEFNINPWELKHKPVNIFDNPDIVFEAIDWVVKKQNFSLRDILSNKLNKRIFDQLCLSEFSTHYKKLSNKLRKNGYDVTFSNSHDVVIFYLNRKYNRPFTYSDFVVKPKEYMYDINNANHELRKFVNLLFANKILNEINFKSHLIEIFNQDTIPDFGQYQLLTANLYHYKTTTFYKWLNNVFPEWGLSPKLFKQVYTFDNKKVDSIGEAELYNYIKRDLGYNIEVVGRNNYKFKMYNKNDDEYYIPDFYIDKINGIKLNKVIIIEFFGMYNNRLSKTNEIYENYNKKTKRKINYYNSRSDIGFVYFYQEDLKSKKNIDKKINLINKKIHGEAI